MPMRTVLLSLLLMIALLNAGEAREVASVAASVKGTLFDQAGTAVAKVATNHGGLRTTVRNYTSASVFVPAIARGQVDFGVANQFEITLALEGEGYFAGREQSNLRAVAVLFPLQTAMFVRQDSPYQRIADLEDQRLPDGFVANKHPRRRFRRRDSRQPAYQSRDVRAMIALILHETNFGEPIDEAKNLGTFDLLA